MPLRKPAKGASRRSRQKIASENISELSHAHPEWPAKRRIAAGLRSAGLSRRRK